MGGPEADKRSTAMIKSVLQWQSGALRILLRRVQVLELAAAASERGLQEGQHIGGLKGSAVNWERSRDQDEGSKTNVAELAPETAAEEQVLTGRRNIADPLVDEVERVTGYENREKAGDERAGKQVNESVLGSELDAKQGWNTKRADAQVERARAVMTDTTPTKGLELLVEQLADGVGDTQVPLAVANEREIDKRQSCIGRRGGAVNQEGVVQPKTGVESTDETTGDEAGHERKSETRKKKRKEGDPPEETVERQEEHSTETDMKHLAGNQEIAKTKGGVELTDEKKADETGNGRKKKKRKKQRKKGEQHDMTAETKEKAGGQYLTCGQTTGGLEGKRSGENDDALEWPAAVRTGGAEVGDTAVQGNTSHDEQEKNETEKDLQIERVLAVLMEGGQRRHRPPAVVAGTQHEEELQETENDQNGNERPGQERTLEGTMLSAKHEQGEKAAEPAAEATVATMREEIHQHVRTRIAQMLMDQCAQKNKEASAEKEPRAEIEWRDRETEAMTNVDESYVNNLKAAMRKEVQASITEVLADMRADMKGEASAKQEGERQNEQFEKTTETSVETNPSAERVQHGQAAKQTNRRTKKRNLQATPRDGATTEARSGRSGKSGQR